MVEEARVPGQPPTIEKQVVNSIIRVYGIRCKIFHEQVLIKSFRNETLVYCFTSVRPSFQNIFRHIFLSNYWWPKCDIWSQASYKCPISWEAFLDLSHSYFLFADLVGFYTHWTYMHLVLSVIFGHFSLIPMRDFVSIKEQCTEESVLSIMSTVSQHTY